MVHERRFDPSQIRKLEDPGRKNWLPPGEIVESLHLQAGWTVADIGAGSGYFTLPLATAVGPEGSVFAVDVSPEMLVHLRGKLAEAHTDNVQCVENEAASTGLESGSCDCVFLANVLHEFDDPSAVLAEMRRILKPGGRMAILDWRADVERVHGPPQEHRISAERGGQLIAEAGFALDSPVQLFPFSWLLIGTRSSNA